MAFDQGTVFVLGAGFTRAFLDDAPLMVDDYGGKELLDSLQGKELRVARGILELELQACNGKINLERMLTRLHGRMPYDFNDEAVQELDLLRSKIERNFQNRLQNALQSGHVHVNELRNFARHCARCERVNCITFNYDTLLDEALWQMNPYHSSGKFWDPHTGYGFPCRTAWLQMIPEHPPIEMLLLKLHGSMNWRIPLGQPKPYGPEAIRHHESWYSLNEYGPGKLDRYEPVLEAGFFFIPPVLTKADLTEQPIIRFLWSKAHEVLSQAERVVFMGYSMPLTDIATGFLFRESLQHLSPDLITVITRQSDEVERAELLRSYRNAFPKLTEAQLDCSGARRWVFDNLPQWVFDSKGMPIAFIFGLHVISRSGQFFGTMIDSRIVWGDWNGDHCRYKGELEGDRLVIRDASIAERKYQKVESPDLPGVPAVIPAQIAAITLPGFRDVEIS